MNSVPDFLTVSDVWREWFLRLFWWFRGEAGWLGWLGIGRLVLASVENEFVVRRVRELFFNEAPVVVLLGMTGQF